MIKKHRLTPEKQAAIDELVRLGNIAVKAAQAESREMGVPNVYSVNGKLIYETATGDFLQQTQVAAPENVATRSSHHMNVNRIHSDLGHVRLLSFQSTSCIRLCANFWRCVSSQGLH